MTATGQVKKLLGLTSTSKFNALNKAEVEEDPEQEVEESKQEESDDTIDLYLANSDYDKLIELFPDDADLYTNRADAYEKLGEVEHAIADYSQEIELDPELKTAESSLIRLGVKTEIN